MTLSDHLLQRGMAFANSGRKPEAHKIFESLISEDRCNQSAWTGYLDTFDSDQEKRKALEEFLTIFPQNIKAQKELAVLRQQGKLYTSTQSTEKQSKEIGVVPPVYARPMEVQPRPQLQASFVIPWLLIVLGVCIFLASAVTFVRGYNSMQARMQELMVTNRLVSDNLDQMAKDNQRLQSERANLSGQYNSLLFQFNNLNNDYTLLRGNFDRLNNEHSLLQGNYNDLYAEYNLLNERYNALAGDYNRLDSIALKPPYIFVHDRQVDVTFYDIDGQLITWSTPFSGLEYAIEKGSYTRSKMIDEGQYTSIAYMNNGEAIEIPDFSIFITPGPFQEVMPKIYSTSSGSREFIYRTWNIIEQLANYASEEQETPRYPYETLLAGGGDCEDLSILFASLIKAAPVNWYVDLVYVDSKSILDPLDPDHVLVYINTGQETYLVETTNDQEMLPYVNGVTGWLGSDLGKENLHPVHLE